jgi:ABC-type dipeptide/oligopeptide/nickel transport system ATPase subunit/GNAT superfamily N-acetyltransferase
LLQVLGMFDVEPAAQSVQQWNVDINLPESWNIGVIVGPSGSGKTTVARELFGSCFAGRYEWSANRSILDGFPMTLPVREIVGLLSSVGFSSPPAWVRPFNALSNGQQFRVTLARTLADAMVDNLPKLVDEYSSVADRTAARIGSAAVAKTVRLHHLQFIAVTCHYDVLDWLEPDWVYEPHVGRLLTQQRNDQIPKPKSQSMTKPQCPNEGEQSIGISKLGFDWDLGLGASDLPSPSREDLQRNGSPRWRRPPITLEIIRTDRSAWPIFKPHHYLSGNLNPASACFVALVEDQPAAFTAVLPFPHPTRSGWREHRTVCLPDFQGVGIGNALSEFIASLYRATGKPYTSTTSHPAMIRHRAKSKLWRMSRGPSLVGGHGKRFNLMRKTSAIDRLTAGFEYVGPPRHAEAQGFGLIA